jgi:hypothetical protein
VDHPEERHAVSILTSVGALFITPKEKICQIRRSRNARIELKTLLAQANRSLPPAT